MANDSHVVKRNGSPTFAEPRPQPEPKPNREPRQHPPAPAAFSGRYSTDPGFAGHVEVDKATFEGLTGRRSPRQKLAAGESVGKVDRVGAGGVHQQSDDVSIADAAPLT